MAKVGVIGAGSWGTALALVLDENKHQVILWSNEAEHIAELRQTRLNPRFLPGVSLPESLAYTDNLAEAAAAVDFLVMAVPSHAVRSVAGQLAALNDTFGPDTVLISVAKGFDPQSYQRMSEILAAAFPQNPVAVFSGPSHAEEVSRRIPTAIVAAAADEAVMRAVQELFSTPNLRVYTNSDVTGVELGGSLKNILALASGICYGMGCGDNTEAALITRGLKEIVRLGQAMGAKAETFYGLSGLGDLVVTCGSQHSRNRQAGVLLGQGQSLDEVLPQVGMVVEGVNATKIAHQLAVRYQVDMPLTECMYQVLFGGLPIEEVRERLMLRDKKPE